MLTSSLSFMHVDLIHLNVIHLDLLKTVESKIIILTRYLFLFFVCLFVWCLTTHQPLWVISVRRYLTKHDLDRKSKNL